MAADLWRGLERSARRIDRRPTEPLRAATTEAVWRVGVAAPMLLYHGTSGAFAAVAPDWREVTGDRAGAVIGAAQTALAALASNSGTATGTISEE